MFSKYPRLLLLFFVELATAIPSFGAIPVNAPMALMKRQSVCVDPVVCYQTPDECSSCPEGTYCDAGGCCDNGETCAGYSPCADAGSNANAAETQICPTDAPLCTVSAGIPICSGSVDDWLTISRALEMSTTEETPSTPTSTPTSSTRMSPTSTLEMFTTPSVQVITGPTFTGGNFPTELPPNPTLITPVRPENTFFDNSGASSSSPQSETTISSPAIETTPATTATTTGSSSLYNTQLLIVKRATKAAEC
ncbi:hypothetical protein AA313_de0204508 [Arthrobotrys entomopaga]|nr:hypothetical protein AA313_de0204508 [Arthrobotrys entomopaga]